MGAEESLRATYSSPCCGSLRNPRRRAFILDYKVPFLTASHQNLQGQLASHYKKI